MLNGTVIRAICAAQRANAAVINTIADMVESWAGEAAIPDVVGRAGAAAWGDVQTAMQANSDLLLTYIDGPATTVAHPAMPPAEPAPPVSAPPAATPPAAAPPVDAPPAGTQADPALQPTS